MLDPTIREDALPFVCQNPACGLRYDLEDLKNALMLWGLIFADCGEFVYEGITCVRCGQTTLRPYPRTNPIVDLRDFIIVPNANPAANTWEQFIQRERAKDDYDWLKFKCIPAWDDETISYADMINVYPSSSYDLYTTPGIPYVMMIPGDVERKQDEENETGEVQLRRLYPDIPKFRNLLTFMSPEKLTEVGIFEEEAATSSEEVELVEESEEKYAAWIGLLEAATGKSLAESARRHLKLLGHRGFDEHELEMAIKGHFQKLYPGFGAHIRSMARTVGFEAGLWGQLKRLVETWLYPACTDVSIPDKSDGVSGWVKSLEGQKALFVDAPMGLGRTYAVIEALGEDDGLSAALFLPTERLCEDTVTRLKTKIALRHGLPYWEHLEYEKGLGCGLERGFLQDEVHYVGAANASASQWKSASTSRIVVATHDGYDGFYDSSGAPKWFRDGRESLKRDVVVLDEEFVLSHCYDPIALEHSQMEGYSAALEEFLSAHPNTQEVIDHIGELFERVRKEAGTSIIPPLDPDFSLPQGMAKDWRESVESGTVLLPEGLDSPAIAGDALEWVASAIRLGVVVDDGIAPAHENGKGGQNSAGRTYLHNPRTYDLAGLPPHVFFDETILDQALLEEKFQNVAFERVTMEVKPASQMRVFQNVHADLPSRWLSQYEPGIKRFVGELVNELGRDRKYLFITSKALKDTYFERFLENEYPGLGFVLEDYGGLKSVDYATECDVAVLLGGFEPRDVVEIAMALPSIGDKLPVNRSTPTHPDLWTWKKSTGQRVYEERYAVVEDFSRVLRLSKYRQAIGRTRYLFDDVDLYVVSTDPISDYAPFLPKPETEQYRSDLFPPRLQRSDSKYEQVKEAVLTWLAEHDTATVTAIHRETGIRRGTVADHLRGMETAGLLVRVGKKYKLPPNLGESSLPG